jgi:pimeloyl-ACP methyl ester carboxylesterase/DNA-binding CsgD family transcriptional regulator
MMEKARAGQNGKDVPAWPCEGVNTGELCPGVHAKLRSAGEFAVQQSIRYVKTSDHVRIAWAECGKGPPLVKAANWLSHLNYDLESPVWRHWIEFLGSHFRLIRYDERGCGLTDWQATDLSPARWVDDLESVIEASKLAEPFALLGVSQGAATSVMYAVRHPERVSHLILYGGYALGWAHREDSEGLRRYRAIMELARLGWGQDNPVFRQLFTGLFIPGGTPEQLGWFNELCRRTTTPEVAVQLLKSRSDVDVRGLLRSVSVPTLVVHALHDEVVPFVNGKLLAAEIPNAEFVQLDSRNHILLQAEPAWTRFKEAVLEFTGRSHATAGDALFGTLSDRERDILAALVAGRSNSEIGATLFISEKTVRNSLTRIFEKLGVRTRTQAAVLARDRGFAGNAARAQR